MSQESPLGTVGVEAKQVAEEIVAGRPGPASRRWLGWVSLTCLALFTLDTLLVSSGVLFHPIDLPIELAVQHFSWGPLTYLMTLTNSTAGVGQDAIGLAVVVALFIYERRAGLLMAMGSIGSLIDQYIKVSIARHRPTADLVQILNPNNGFSYPSGHAVFFTWLYFMLGMAIAPKLSLHRRRIMWTVIGVLIFFACLGRIWAGAHWPSDVLGGFLLAMSWCAFILWLPERWLPAPTWWSKWRSRAHS